MSKPYVIGVDPSGSYNEGKGTTGIVVLNPEGLLMDYMSVKAQEYDSQMAYWMAVIDHIDVFTIKYSQEYNVVLSVEDYVLYATTAKAQINSEMETSKLIGAIMMWAYHQSIPIHLRNASQVKNRWNNRILEYKNVIRKKGNRYVVWDTEYIDRHCLDALRHALHCYHFELKEDD